MSMPKLTVPVIAPIMDKTQLSINMLWFFLKLIEFSSGYEQKPSLSNMTNNNENVVRIIKVRAEWRKSVLPEFDFHVWNESFESDNFGKKKIVELVNSYLKKYNEKLSIKEISKQMRKGRTLMRAIKVAYSSKYHDSIYKKVPRKPDLSLELMNSRLKQISREKKTGSHSR